MRYVFKWPRARLENVVLQMVNKPLLYTLMCVYRNKEFVENEKYAIWNFNLWFLIFCHFMNIVSYFLITTRWNFIFPPYVLRLISFNYETARNVPVYTTNHRIMFMCMMIRQYNDLKKIIFLILSIEKCTPTKYSCESPLYTFILSNLIFN